MTKTDTLNLYIDTDKKEVFYRGYRLILTKCEYYILLAIYLSEQYIGADALVKTLDSFKDTGNTSVAVHVFNINSKTKNIDGKKLINHTGNGDGYFICK